MAWYGAFFIVFFHSFFSGCTFSLPCNKLTFHTFCLPSHPPTTVLSRCVVVGSFDICMRWQFPAVGQDLGTLIYQSFFQRQFFWPGQEKLKWTIRLCPEGLSWVAKYFVILLMWCLFRKFLSGIDWKVHRLKCSYAFKYTKAFICICSIRLYIWYGNPK